MGPTATRLFAIASATVVLAGCGDDARPSGDAAPDLPAWDPTLPSASVMGERRGLVPARGLNHFHSPYSHDACDGDPRPGGVPDEACLSNLRAGVCATRMDFANLTDHDDSMADEEFATLFSMRGTDTPIMRGGVQIGSRIACDNGHSVMVTVGSENDLMPIMLDRHVDGDAAQRHATYNSIDAAAAAAFRAAGALVWAAHTESKTLEMLREVEIDGIEVYNMHANIDPDIRVDYLGLDSSGGIAGALEFTDTQPGHPEPDLAFLGFVLPNEPAIATWNALLGEGRHVSVTAGSDVHENALPIMMADGERGDSYRRVMRWFNNVVLVADPTDLDQVETALDTGRNFVLFELFGTPEAFDVYVTAAGTTYELGATVPAGSDVTMSLTMPTVRGLAPELPVPQIMAKVIKVAPGGTATVVHQLAGDTNPGTSQLTLDGPGAYRVELSIIPRHLGPYLRDLGTALADVERPWIYTGAFYVE